MCAVADGAPQDRRQIWGMYGGTYHSPASSPSGAVNHLERYVTRHRHLRQIADDHAVKFQFWRGPLLPARRLARRGQALPSGGRESNVERRLGLSGGQAPENRRAS
jgi:hypothetical protein